MISPDQYGLEAQKTIITKYHAAALVAENKVFREINENRVGSTKFSKLEDFLEAIHVEGVNGVIVK